MLLNIKKYLDDKHVSKIPRKQGDLDFHVKLLDFSFNEKRGCMYARVNVVVE